MTAVLKNTLNSTVKQSLERKILCTQPFESPHYFIQKKFYSKKKKKSPNLLDGIYPKKKNAPKVNQAATALS